MLVVAATERELEGLADVDTLCCGIGPVESALATTRALVERRPSAIVHVGIAGAHTLQPPAIVLGSEAIYCDIVDVESTMPRIERVGPDASLLAAASAALPDAVVAPIGTTARVGGSHGCDVEAMEGFGVLRAAQLAGVPAVELRAVSNAIGDPDRSHWRFDDAFAALQNAVRRVVSAA